MGDNINQKDANGRTPLHFCCLLLRETLLMILLKQNAQVNIPDNQGYKALQLLS
jgi:ankyrin repeat protein